MYGPLPETECPGDFSAAEGDASGWDARAEVENGEQLQGEKATEEGRRVARVVGAAATPPARRRSSREVRGTALVIVV